MKRLDLLASSVIAAAVVCGGAAPAQSPATPAYKVVNAVPLGGPDRWDYVVHDGATQRVYVAHGDRVSVVDVTHAKVIGEVTGITGGAHGVGVSNATGKGYTDDGKGGLAVAFDLKTFQVLKRIDAKEDADAIAFDAKSGHVFVVNGDSKALTVIDPATDMVIATIDTGGGMETAVAGGDGKLYVNGAKNKEVIRVDIKTNTIDARWPLPDCAGPHGLAFDPFAHRAFVTCINKVMTVVNTDTGAVVASLPIGLGSDAAVFDPSRKRALSSNADGTLSIIQEVDPNTFVSLGSIKTAQGGRTMSIDHRTGRLFIAAADMAPPGPPGPDGKPARPKPVPGSLKLLFLDPVD